MSSLPFQTVRAFGLSPSYGLGWLLRAGQRISRLPQSRLRDTAQASRGNHNRLRHTPAGFTALALDGYGRRDHWPARPAKTAT